MNSLFLHITGRGLFEILHGSIVDGSYISLISNGNVSKYKLLHDRDVGIIHGQRFITTSDRITQSSVDKIILHLGKMVDITDRCKIVLKRKSSKEILGIKYISSAITDSIVFDKHCVSELFQYDFTADKIEIEIDVLCPVDIKTCCDKLPSNMTLIPNNIYLCTDCNITPSITTTTSTTSSTTTTNPPSQQEQLPSPQSATFALSSQPCGGIYFPDNSPSINIIENIAYRQYKFDPSTSLQVVYYIIEIGYYGNSTNNTPSWISVVPPQVYNNSEQNINLCGYFPISGAGFYQIRVKIRISSGILADSDYVFSDFISIPI